LIYRKNIKILEQKGIQKSEKNQNRKSNEKGDSEVNVRTPNVTKEKVKEEETDKGK
jgi:hypothetical protein